MILPSGYVIPKGTVALTNIKKFLLDPELWDDPELFLPSRFIDDNGRFYHPDYFVPFGHGRRICMGEPLAKNEIFIFFVTLVQRLRVQSVPGKEPDPNNYTAGQTRCPLNFVVSIEQR